MTARLPVAALLLGALLAAALPLRGAADPTAPEVVFYAPDDNQPAYGETEIEVDVYADDVRQVIFLVDGSEVGRSTRPPYRVTVQLGDSFAAHRFEAVAMGADRELVRGVLETPPLTIDERIDLGLQQLYVTVERAGGSVAPLEPEEFRVLDNGVPQEIVTFERGDAALTVGLLVDASDSMRGGHLEAALEGVHAFLLGMRELDEAAVYLFSDSIRFRSPFLQRADRLRGGLASVEAGGGTAIHDALYVAIRQLESRQGRRVVVLLSDGSDIHSALQVDDVLWTMRRSQSLVYWIELDGGRGGAGKTSPWRTAERHREELDGLRRLVAGSGGRVVPIATPAEAAEAFADILAELRRQYVLGYYPSDAERDGRWHSVDVRIARKGHRARTRGGYVAH